MTITRFCLVRHGEIDWNAERRLQGHTDIGINARGLAQAEQMARAIKRINLAFDVLYTSDLQRVVKTAKAIEQIIAQSPLPMQGLESDTLERCKASPPMRRSTRAGPLEVSPEQKCY
jgi:probable phosphoglycerate mutase